MTKTSLNNYTKGDIEVGCHYCGFKYHPMLRMTRRHPPPTYIYVCEFKIVDGEIELSDSCKQKALHEGYTIRRDLTPSR